MKRLFKVLVFLSAILISGCAKQYVFDNDLIRTKADMSGYTWLSDTSDVFDLVSIDESYRLFEENETGVILYSRTSCPFCNAAVVLLNDAAKETGVRILYCDIEDPDFMILPIGQRDAKIMHLMELIDEILKTDVNGEKAFFIPVVIAVKDGEIVDSYTSVMSEIDTENFEDNKKEDLQAMKEIYKRIIHAAMD